jgi:hypothetical protein
VLTRATYIILPNFAVAGWDKTLNGITDEDDCDHPNAELGTSGYGLILFTLIGVRRYLQKNNDKTMTL